MSDQTITLTKVYNPLDRSDQDIVQWQYQPGSTVADLLDNTGTIITKREGHQLVVSVNGQVIPADQYDQTHLVPGQCVTLVPVLTGGSTDSKNVLRTVGMVVLAVIATVVSVFGFLGPNGAVTGFLWKMAFASAIMTVGMAIYGAFAGGGSTQPPALNGYQGADQSNSYSWNPQITQQQGIPIPWYYGTCKVTGNVIGVWRESIGNQQYLNALICVGDGVLSGITDIMLNDQPLANYAGIELHTRLGYLSQAVIPNFGDTVTEYAQGTKVNYGTPVSYTTIGADFDALEVEAGFPNGLYYYDDYGNLQPLAVNFQISVRKTGTTPWTIITRQPSTTKVSAGGYWSAGEWVTEYYDEYGSPGPSTWIEYANGGTNPNSYYDGQSYDGWRTWRWIGDPIRVVDIMLDYVTAYAGQSGAIRYNYRANGLEQGQYEIQVSRLSTDYTDTRHGDEFYLMAVREVVLDDFTYPGTALIGLRALATDQLSGSFSFSCRTTGKMCRVHTGAAWTVAATSNPAWVCFDILTQPVFDNSFNVLEYRAHNPDNLDLTRWVEWAQYCDDLVPDGSGGTEKRLTYNGGFDSSQSMWDAALSVARTGRATPYWRGTTVTVAIDKPSSPVALISVGNIGLDSFEETFLGMDDRAGSIEADFLNLEKDLDRDKFTVINPDAPPEWGSASLPMQGVIRPSEVWRHCRYHLATTQNLTRVVTVQMDTDSIAFTLGDIIQVQHDVPMWGEGGRVVLSTTTTLVLDKQVTIAADKTYSIMLHLLDGTIVERTVVTPPGTTDTITISTPFTAAPDPFDVYAFGEVESSIKPMRVVGIDSAGDLKRKITLTDYNETVYNADLLQPVLPTVNYSGLELPAVQGLILSERLVAGLSGAITSVIDVSWYPVNDSLTKYVEIFIDGASYSKYEININTAAIPVSTGISTVTARTVGYAGNAQSLSVATSASILVLGLSAPPPDVTGARINCIDTQAHLSWTPVSDIGLSHYTVKFSPAVDGASWSSSVALVPQVSGNSITVPAMVGSYLIKAIRYGGSESTNAAMVTSSIAGIAGLNAVELVEPAPAWSGTHASTTVVDGVLRLASADTLSDWTGLSAVKSLAYGLNGYAQSGSYQSDTIIDLGLIYTSRLTAQMQSTGNNTLNVMSGWSTLSSVVRLSGAEPGEWNAVLQVSTTQEDPALDNWSAWQEFIVGDYSARAFRFRLLLYSYRPEILVQIPALSINIDMPDRIISAQDITCPAAGMRIDFVPGFRSLKALAIDGQDMLAGDYKTVTGKDETGYTLRFFNSAGTGVERTFDAIATGYGQEV